MQGILFAAAIVGVVGLLIGVLLGVAAEKLKVEEDARIGQVRECLPGNNCGGCGFPGCDGLAAAIVAGEASVSGCPVGGNECAQNIAEIMGVEAEEVERKVAFVKCLGHCDNAKNDYEYVGDKDCRLMAFVPGGGAKSCNYGCMGYGSCMKVCTNDAISIKDGIAVVDPEKCGACGQCATVCPNNLIEMVPYKARVHVLCNSEAKGKDVMKACTVGCIGCKKCERTCKFDAIKVVNNLAVIDYSKCVGCGLCAKECPRGIIVKEMVKRA